MHVGIFGEVRCVVTQADGTVKKDTGFQKNLILNQGLDFFGGGRGASINASCAIGSGNSTPVVTQTKLDSFLALTSGTDTTSNYSYVDEGDDLYKMWEQKKYRFTGLDDANISEVGLVSTGSTSANYYLTTRALIKDSAGAPTSISVKTGETLDIYYKIHKIIDTRDKLFVINVLDGSGGSVPYDVTIRPAKVGDSANHSVTSPLQVNSASGVYVGSMELSSITTTPAEENDGYIAGAVTLRPVGENPRSRIADVNIPLSSGNAFPIRTVYVKYANPYRPISIGFFPFQMRFGRVSDDAPLTKTNKDTLSIPFEISWGRFEGDL